MVKSFPIQGESAICLKLAGFSGWSSAEPLGMSRMLPTFQAAGTEPEDQRALYRSKRAGMRDGQCHMISDLWDWDWHFAAQLLDEDKPNTSPSFSANKAESFFRKSYSCESREFVHLD